MKGKCSKSDGWMAFRDRLSVFRNVASFAEAYKRRKEFMSELNKRIKWDLKINLWYFYTGAMCS